MHSVRHARQALRGIAVLSSAAVLAAGCAGAGGAGKLGAKRQRGTVSNGNFVPGGSPAASYGPNPSLRCGESDVSGAVFDELGTAAKKAGKPVPGTDGRVCTVAETFLGWDPATKVRPGVAEFVSHFYGLTSAVQQPIIAIVDSSDPKDVADRIVKAIGTPALNAAHPVVGIATTAVQTGTSQQTRLGTVSGKTKVSVVLLDEAVEVDAFPRRLDAGQQASLTGRLLGDLTSPKVSVSDTAGKVAVTENPGGKDFKADVTCGDKPGEIRVEIRGERGGQSAGTLANFPVTCATQPPTAVAIATEPWPTEVPQQERKVFDFVNEERTKAGLQPLAWDDAVADVARGIAESLKGGGTGTDVRERLDKAGIASPVVLQSLAADRSAERAADRLANSPTNRSNILNTDVNHLGVGLFSTTDAQNAPVVYVAEVFIKELPPVDVAAVRAKLRDAVAQKRKDARAGAVTSDPVLEDVAEKYAQALAAGGGTLSKEEAAKITAPLNTAFKQVNLVAGAKQEPLDFAEEPQIVASGKSLGVGVAQGKNPSLGRNATYVTVMIGVPRAEAAGKRAKAAKAARTRK